MPIRKKRMMLLTITVVALLIFLWQLHELFNKDILANTKMDLPANSSSGKPMVVDSIKPLKQIGINSTDQIQKSAYLDLVNRYQVAKLEHKLLQEQLAIAHARQELAALEQKTNSEDASQPILHFGTGLSSNESLGFKLVYLGFQNGQWTATVNQNGHYRHLEPGANLPGKGRVISINKKGILIGKGEDRYRLTFNAMKLLSSHSSKNKNGKELSQNILPTNTKSTEAFPIVGKVFAEKNILSQKKSLDETVLLEMPAQSYTIKLMEKDNKKALLQFAKQFQVEDRTLIYSHFSGNIRYFTLLYGDYLTLQAAHSAFDRLSPNLKKESPSIVQIKSIQEEIRE